jgi:hypothetical protein
MSALIRASRPYPSPGAAVMINVTWRGQHRTTQRWHQGWNVQRSHQRTASQRWHQRQMARIPPGRSSSPAEMGTANPSGTIGNAISTSWSLGATR